MHFFALTHHLFDIEETVRSFARMHKWQASHRRRSSTATTGAGQDGFTLLDVLWHLYEKFPALYAHGFSKSAVHRLFKPHNRGTLNGSAHYAIVNARVAKKSNSSRKMSEGTHFQRAQEKIVQEFFARHNQPNVSGDDMNIIQVGRPAVSRYHQQTRWFMDNQGPDHAIHDFPTAHLGIKLGGFMFLSSNPNTRSRAARSRSCER